jgi:hypothetical protein
MRKAYFIGLNFDAFHPLLGDKTHDIFGMAITVCVEKIKICVCHRFALVLLNKSAFKTSKT